MEWFNIELLRPAIAAGVLVLLWTAESMAPMFSGRKRRTPHAARNLALGVLNAAVMGLVFATALLVVSEWSQRHGVGFLRLVDMPAWAHWLAALVLFDFWQYIWHRMNHAVPLLWRMHSVHHSDPELDVSSGVRFHTGEIALSAVSRLAVLPLMGMTIEQLAVYELIVMPIVLFHHSNIRISPRVDRLLRIVIVTPRMHWVHHSRYRPETDSNFASGLSVWDRLLGTFRLRKDPLGIRLGLDGFDEARSMTLLGMLKSPLQRTPRGWTGDDGGEGPDRSPAPGHGPVRSPSS